MVATLAKRGAKPAAVVDEVNPILSCVLFICDTLTGEVQTIPVPKAGADILQTWALALQVAEDHPSTTWIEARLLSSGVKIKARSRVVGRLPARAPSPDETTTGGDADPADLALALLERMVGRELPLLRRAFGRE